MSSIEFKLKDDDLKKIEQSIMEYGDDAESIINDFLRDYASNMVVDAIVVMIPQSGRMWKGKRKPARSGNPFKTDFINLGFTIKSKKTYNYLYFPDQAAGTSQGKSPLLFMEKGMDNVYDSIVNGILNKLTKEE